MNLDLIKTATFAVLHFSVGFTVTYLLTGSVAISTGVALIEPSVNTVVFFFHEKAWQRLMAKRQGVDSRPAVPAVVAPCPVHRAGVRAGAWGLPQGACAKPHP
ncbi:MAG: DUF2061 domain-containing protein [Kiloniellaceae bacterium]